MMCLLAASENIIKFCAAKPSTRGYLTHTLSQWNHLKQLDPSATGAPDLEASTGELRPWLGVWSKLQFISLCFGHSYVSTVPAAPAVDVFCQQ